MWFHMCTGFSTNRKAVLVRAYFHFSHEDMVSNNAVKRRQIDRGFYEVKVCTKATEKRTVLTNLEPYYVPTIIKKSPHPKGEDSVVLSVFG